MFQRPPSLLKFVICQRASCGDRGSSTQGCIAIPKEPPSTPTYLMSHEPDIETADHPLFSLCSLRFGSSSRFGFVNTLRKLTWQWKITMFNTRYIFKRLFFRCHVSFQECTIVGVNPPSKEGFQQMKGPMVKLIGPLQPSIDHCIASVETKGLAVGYFLVDLEEEIRLTTSWIVY